ncbi:MAG: L-histidine N(alpha)-methyltransferase, partial [Opitutaceae bacterium]|nr:L-histidine N(alpha)-methyltransferase [Opitutaceae bacterium]
AYFKGIGEHYKAEIIASIPAAEDVSLYRGFLEPTSSCTDIVHALQTKINSPTDVLPQKYLYSSLHGAELWRELCTRSSSHINQVYTGFPLGWGSNELTGAFSEIIDLALGQSRTAGFIALGAGTGTREAKICDWLCKTRDLRRLEAVLVDVSSELLGDSLNRFAGCVPAVRRHFAVLDFEQPQGEAQLAHLRDHLGAMPVVFAFLGNTFGNLDQRAFLGLMSRLMRANDVLLCELLIVPEAQTYVPGRTDGSEASLPDPRFNPREDVRSQFIIDPLRTFGFNPRIDGLTRRVAYMPGRGIRQTYRYVFSQADAEQAKSLTIEPRPNIRRDTWIDLLNIQALTDSYCRQLFEEEFPANGVRLVTHPYTTTRGDVLMGYCFASRLALGSPQRRPAGTATAPIAAEAAGTSQARLVIRRSRREVICDGEVLRLTGSYYAFVSVLAEKFTRDQPETKAMVVQGLVAARLKDLLQKQPEWFDERSQKFVQNASTALDADPISHLKSDLKKALAAERERTVAAQALAAWLPGDKEWNLRLLPSEVAFE